jgi:hypothetical protein
VPEHGSSAASIVHRLHGLLGDLLAEKAGLGMKAQPRAVLGEG